MFIEQKIGLYVKTILQLMNVKFRLSVFSNLCCGDEKMFKGIFSVFAPQSYITRLFAPPKYVLFCP